MVARHCKPHRRTSYTSTLFTAETNAITANGSKIGGAGTTFAVNDVVSIVDVVRDGTAVATAVADQRVSDLNGPPMDGV